MTDINDSVESLTGEQQELAAELVAKARPEGVELTGPNRLLASRTKQVPETALAAEITDYLGTTSTTRLFETVAIRVTGLGPGPC